MDVKTAIQDLFTNPERYVSEADFFEVERDIDATTARCEHPDLETLYKPNGSPDGIVCHTCGKVSR